MLRLQTTSSKTTTLLLYIVSNVFYILGMAHRVHYATRIDWTPRKLHSNAVFWHSLAPDKLEPHTLFPYPLKPSIVPTDLCPLCRSQLGGFYSIYILIL